MWQDPKSTWSCCACLLGLQGAALRPVLGRDTHSPQVSEGFHGLGEGEDLQCSEALMGTHWALSPRAGSHSAAGGRGHLPDGVLRSGPQVAGLSARQDDRCQQHWVAACPAGLPGDPQHSGHLLRQRLSLPWRGLRGLQWAEDRARPPAQCQRLLEWGCTRCQLTRRPLCFHSEPGEGAWVWGVPSGSRARWG